MHARIIALATAALIVAAPLSGAEAGRLTDIAKASLKANAKLARTAVKGAAKLAAKSVAINALALKCALKEDC
jgi:hypothetical protein